MSDKRRIKWEFERRIIHVTSILHRFDESSQSDVEEGATKIVNSRYSIVLATSKRARQIIGGELPLVPTKHGEKPLSIAIDELNNGKIKIIAEDTEE